MAASEHRAPDLARLERIMARLRGEGGCPWDREQTLASLQRYLVEEAYEVLDVMAGEDPAEHREELGDLLFQIVFQSQIRREQGAFVLADVVDDISDKLERRHPHVFGDESAADAGAVAARWEELKKAEGKGTFDGIPRALPALMRAEKVGKKASRLGFDWPDVEGPLAKLDEELAELRQAIASGDATAAAAELGDLLFSVVNVARHLKADPEAALDRTTERFLARFRYIERRLAETGRRPEDTSLDALDALWNEAKAALAGGTAPEGA